MFSRSCSDELVSLPGHLAEIVAAHADYTTND